jgi:hypothetical protein
MPMMQQPQMRMPQMQPPMQMMGGMPPQQHQQMNPAQIYAQKGMMLIPAVVKTNPNYKNQVGEYIFEYVEKIAGDQHAPKITGMLIDLPIEEIQSYLQDYSKLEGKVTEAVTLLNSN